MDNDHIDVGDGRCAINLGKIPEDFRPPRDPYDLPAETDWVVEASDADYFLLWRIYAEEANAYRHGLGTQIPHVRWEQVRSGIGPYRIGSVGGHPVAVMVSFAYIERKLVAFVSASSRVVDWDIVDAWVGKAFPAARERKCDVNNFHQCLNGIGYNQVCEESAVDKDGFWLACDHNDIPSVGLCEMPPENVQEGAVGA